jgi:hypothetical protein
MSTKAKAPPDPWAKLDQIRASVDLDETPNVPAGAFGIEEYARRYKLPIDTARSQLKRLKQLGKLKAGKARKRTSDGRWVMFRIYWPA